jgi:hypothetical protein
MKVGNGEMSEPAKQRNRSLIVHREFEPISPKRSLPLSVQFRDFFAAKPPKRSVGGNNQFLSVAVGTAHGADQGTGGAGGQARHGVSRDQ